MISIRFERVLQETDGETCSLPEELLTLFCSHSG